MQALIVWWGVRIVVLGFAFGSEVEIQGHPLSLLNQSCIKYRTKAESFILNHFQCMLTLGADPIAGTLVFFYISIRYSAGPVTASDVVEESLVIKLD